MLGGAALLMAGRTYDAPTWTRLEQNTRTVEWLSVSRATIPQSSSRKIRITGPWMDYIAGVNGNGGVSGRSINHVGDKQSTLILDAAAHAPRGNKYISVIIDCPLGANLLGCTRGPVEIPVKVFETGPVRSIKPSGTVEPNAMMTFTLYGDGMNYAALLPRIVNLRNAVVLGRSADTIAVRGITPSCGYIDVALTDQEDGDEFPYRKAAGYQPGVAGSMCGGR